MKKYVKFRHKFYFPFLRPIARLLARRYHFKTKKEVLDKKQNYLILSNHQSFLDPAFVAISIRRPIYFVASDALWSRKWYIRLLLYAFGPIRIRKGTADISCVRTLYAAVKEGGTVAIFPEGNRQWNDSCFHIERSVVKLVRLLKVPVILYNFHGGYGVQPRWGKSIRKGKYTGGIREILSVERLNGMNDDELYEKIVSGLRVIDSESGEKYRSKERAEYLERELFVCPKCGLQDTLVSRGNEISCTRCGLTASYGEDLRFTSADPAFKFERLIDWYEDQLRYVRELDLEKRKVLCSDKHVRLFDKTSEDRTLLSEGEIFLEKERLTVGEWSISTAEIFGGSANDGNKFSFNAGEKSYIVIGDERFNGIKYLLFFNRVCEQIVKMGGDKYYGLDPDWS